MCYNCIGDNMSDIDKLREYVDSSDNIVFFGGAGVSTESGIKDFRGKNGLYREKNNGLPPEYMLSHECLIYDTELFFDYYRNNMNLSDREPNVTHQYLKKLEDSGKLKAVITQNIDGLHQKAGSKNVIEIHGTIYKNYCMKCNKEYPSDYIFKSKGIPKCTCGGLIRPDVILYGESLNDSYNKALDYIRKADLLIVAGTSLTVEPASSMIRFFNGKKLVIINMDKTSYDSIADLVINKPLGEIFSKL